MAARLPRLGVSGTFSVVQTNGNEGILAEVQSHPGAIGFLDMGYTYPALGSTPATGLKVLSLDDTTTNHLGGVVFAAPTVANLKTACKDLLTNGAVKGTSTTRVVRGLYLFTKGDPTRSSTTTSTSLLPLAPAPTPLAPRACT